MYVQFYLKNIWWVRFKFVAREFHVEFIEWFICTIRLTPMCYRTEVYCL
jgi:hypothetical protein